MDLKLKEKNEEEVTEKKKSAPVKSGRSIAELASLSTLSKEELEEANDEDADDEYDDAEYVEDDSDEEGYDNEEDENTEDSEQEEPVEENDPPMEHYGRKFTFEGKPTPNDVFRFMFYHTYFSVVGVFAVLIVIASVIMAVWSFVEGKTLQGVLFSAVFLFFIINSPLSLKKRSKKQSQSMCSEEGTITYTFSDAGFDMTRQTEYASYTYDRILKVIPGKTAYYVYLGKMRAFLAPKADLGENEETFVQLIRENVKKFKG